MATRKGIIIYILVVFALYGYAQPDSVGCIAQRYESQIGVRELTGRNDGAEVEAYLESVGRKRGDAWCAAFVHWVLHECDEPRVRSGWSPSWFPTARVIYTRGGTVKATPQQGDVFGIWFANLDRIAHVGFIDVWGTDWVVTVEGNTNDAGSREGDGVYRKRRVNRQVYKVARWKH